MLKVRPDLWQYWNFDKNDELGLDIWKVTKGSGKKAWWYCDKCGSNCEVIINSKVSNVSCVYCTNQRANETNSLASLMPEILEEWDYENNTEISPYDIVCFSNKKVWWKCLKCKSSYQSKVYSKTSRNQGCPYCANLKVNHTNSLAAINPTLAKEWHPTKNGNLTPHDVTHNSGKKVWWLGCCGHEWKTKVWSKLNGSGCPYCSNHKVLKGFNDMWTTNPELAKLLLNPEDGYRFMQNSGKKLDWKCPDCESVIRDSPNSRYSLKVKCPYCTNRKVNHTNSLATKNPELASEWHPTKNGELTPNDVIPYTNKKAWWLGECGHEWESVIASRINGCGCPYCSLPPKKVLVGFNDIWTTNTELAKLLHNPDDGYKYTQQSNKKVDWRCPECDMVIKERNISNVFRQGLRCPACTDYVSYPEKVMTNLLRILGLRFKYDSATAWSNKKRYDFYFNHDHRDIIIETHGGQHYFESWNSIGGMTLEEVQENDRYKYELAIQNGIKPENYIVIDCRYSNFEHIKDNILSSWLIKMFDFNKVDWNIIFAESNKSFKKQVLEDWNLGLKNVKELAEKYSIDKGTVTNLLKEASKIDMCDYSSQNNLFMLSNTYEILDIFDSVEDANKTFPQITRDRIRKYNKDKKLFYNCIWILCRTHEINNIIAKLKEEDVLYV